ADNAEHRNTAHAQRGQIISDGAARARCDFGRDDSNAGNASLPGRFRRGGVVSAPPVEANVSNYKRGIARECFKDSCCVHLDAAICQAETLIKLEQGAPQGRKCSAMLALKIIAFTAVRNCAHEHRLVRAKIVTRIGLLQLMPEIALDRPNIEDSRGEFADGPAMLMRDVPRHRQRFQVNLRTHDGRAEAKNQAAFERLHRVREDKKVPVTRVSECGAIAVRMLVDDVVTDTGVDRGRNGKPVRGSKDAEIAMWKIAIENTTANVLSEAKVERACLRHPVVNFARLIPQSELPIADVARHAFRRGADPRKLIFVDCAGAIHRDMANETALHQIDNVAVDSGSNQVRAEDQDAGGPGLARSIQALSDGGQIGMFKRGRLIFEIQPAIQL